MFAWIAKQRAELRERPIERLPPGLRVFRSNLSGREPMGDTAPRPFERGSPRRELARDQAVDRKAPFLGKRVEIGRHKLHLSRALGGVAAESLHLANRACTERSIPPRLTRMKKAGRRTTPLLFLAAACATQPAAVPSAPDRAPPVSANGESPTVTAPSSAFAPFEPTRANPEQKAKLAAVAPKIDAYFDAVAERTGTAGLAVGVVVGGELAYFHGVGVQDFASKVPITEDSVFRIASMSKAFAALAVVMLRDAGAIALDEPLSTYLPEARAIVPPTKDSPQITPRLLLTHASGLPWDDMWGRAVFGFSEEDLRALLQAQPTFGSVPGTQYTYSNVGYALLGELVARVSGVPFRDYIGRNIFAPLGMRESFWRKADVPAGRLALAYYKKPGAEGAPEPVPHAEDGVFGAAGGIYTSARDYARFVALNLDAYPPRDAAEMGPVRRASLREMHLGQRPAQEPERPVAWFEDDELAMLLGSYGLGWIVVTTCDEDRRVQHGGMLPGYRSIVVLLPDYGVGFFIFAASGGPEDVVGAIGRKTTAGLLGMLREGGVLVRRPLAAPSPRLLELRARVMKLFSSWDAKLATELVEPENFAWFDTLGARFDELRKKHGACRPDGEPRSDNGTHVGWTLLCERGSIEFNAHLTPARTERLQFLWWKEHHPPSQALDRAAGRLTAAFGTQRAPAGLLWGDRARRSNLDFQKLSLAHKACRVERPLTSDGETSATYRLLCANQPVELSLSIDKKTGRVTAFDAHAPEDPYAPCRRGM